ncbi:hypothetical protein F5Y10DRAFT_105093 [Nemania abortiva]|nr:hypothetical protein F5Y10DRAFT_105093 [Nemania abortiva]
MMLDPLSGIGLAGNLIQFVDSGIKVVSAFREISASADGALHENKVSEAIIKDLQSQIQILKDDDQLSLDWETEALLQDCEAVAKDLSRHFLALQPKSKGIIDRIRATGKSIQTREKILNAETRLFKIRDQITSRLVSHVFAQKQQLSASINSFIDNDDNWKREMETKLNKSLFVLERLRRDNAAKEDLTRITQILKTTLINIRNTHITHAILKSLYFHEIKQRESEILEAHRQTFTWALQGDGDSCFIRWLASVDPSVDVFWVSGKAGSGKSTLMKFLYRHPRTLEVLRLWAESKQLIIAGHFFWSLGVPFQKTQEGLLRSLLYQVFIKCPDLIPKVCRNRYVESGLEHLEPWSRNELFDTLKTLSTLKGIPVKMCLFIDGLDEYTGDHIELINLLKTLNKSTDIKICAASRPWVDFLDAFNHSSWKLHVHNLTSNDIRLYIRDYLENDPRFQDLKQDQPVEANELTSEIATKAQGVFLWVYLVVRELLRGLRNLDSIIDLHRRLLAIPPDLEPYFKMMLESIDKVYRQRAAKVFRILLHSQMTLPVLTFYFVDQEETDPQYALRPTTLLGNDSHIWNLIQRKKVQLIAQCKDILHLSTAEGEPYMIKERAGFLHRTVADFLQSNGINDLLDEMLPPNFDARVSLCRAFLAEIKGQRPTTAYLPSQVTRVKDHVENLVLGVVFYAYASEVAGSRAHLALLEELESVVFDDFVFLSTYPIKIGRERTKSLLDLSSRCGLNRFVLNRVGDSGVNQAGVLRNALEPRIMITHNASFEATIADEYNVSLVKDLLELGISPNMPLSPPENMKTIWEEYIAKLVTSRSFRKLGDSGEYGICSLMLSHGADKTIKVGGNSLAINFSSVFSGDLAVELTILLRRG